MVNAARALARARLAMMTASSSADAKPHQQLLRSESAARHARGLGHPVPCVRRPTNSFIENSIEAVPAWPGHDRGLGHPVPCVRTLLARPWPVLGQACCSRVCWGKHAALVCVGPSTQHKQPIARQVLGQAGVGPSMLLSYVLGQAPFSAGTGMEHQPAACRQAWAGRPAGMGISSRCSARAACHGLNPARVPTDARSHDRLGSPAPESRFV